MKFYPLGYYRGSFSQAGFTAMPNMPISWYSTNLFVLLGKNFNLRITRQIGLGGSKEGEKGIK
jgi:hypothetical protein